MFADVDPVTMNVTAETIEARLSARARRPSSSPTCSATRARWTRSWPLAAAHGIPVIEDCAQAYLGAEQGPAGRARIGAIGCFSPQQGKHITTGEGGFVVTNDAALARRMRLFVNKAWPLRRAEPRPRVPRAQLPHHRAAERGARWRSSPSSPANVAARIANADRLTKQLAGIAGHRHARACARATSTPTGGTACGSTATSSPAAPAALAAG